MKLWAFFFVLWLALCGLGYAWLHPETTFPGTEYSVNYFLGESTPQGILPGDLPQEVPLETH